MPTSGDKLTGPVAHEESAGRGVFHITRDGRRMAQMTYRRTSATHVVIDHTFVDPGLRGGGVARALLDAAVAWARGTQTKMSSTCSYASAHFARDASLRDVVA